MSNTIIINILVIKIHNGVLKQRIQYARRPGFPILLLLFCRIIVNGCYICVVTWFLPFRFRVATTSRWRTTRLFVKYVFDDYLYFLPYRFICVWRVVLDWYCCRPAFRHRWNRVVRVFRSRQQLTFVRQHQNKWFKYYSALEALLGRPRIFRVSVHRSVFPVRTYRVCQR